MAILGIDLGEKKIGLAISYEGSIAKKLPAINIGHSQFSGSISCLKKLCQREKVAKLVIGLPITLRDEEGHQAQKIKKNSEIIKKSLGLPVFFEDETFSSKISRENLEAEGVSPKKIKKLIDSESARIILQSWLDQEGEA